MRRATLIQKKWMSSSFHWFRRQKRSFFSPGVMSGRAVNCYHKKTWWLKRGQSSGPPGFQRKMCESILTCATCYIKIHISGFWMLFFYLFIRIKQVNTEVCLQTTHVDDDVFLFLWTHGTGLWQYRVRSLAFRHVIRAPTHTSISG